MKYTYNEFDSGFWITLEPENNKEVSQLARVALNAKSKPAIINMSFSGEQPDFTIHINKIDKRVQRNSISPKTKLNK